jgi:zinc protease
MKNHRSLFLSWGLLATTLFPWATGATAQTPDLDAPIPPDPAVITGTLENGLTYFIHENDEPENRTELRLAVNAGSILEDDDQLGLAHFVEHMAFNGTRNFEKQALVDYLESIGMQFGPHINAYTGFDETVYMLRVPMDDPEMLSTAFQILVDWAGGLLFDPEEVDKERGVVIEEWRGRRGAQARVQDQQFPVIFHGSHYAERLPIGDPEVLKTAPPEVLRRFYEDWYRPDLMAVVAVGDFEAADMETMIRERFSDLGGPVDPRPRSETEVPIDHEPLISIATDPEMPFTRVSVLYKQPPSPRGTVGDFRRARVRSLYSRMLNERINELTVQADPPFLQGGVGGGGFVRGVDASQFNAIVGEDGVGRGLDALLTEAERAARHGFTASELEREKASLRRSYESRLAEVENRVSRGLASRYVNVFLEGTPYPSVETEMELLDAVLPGITLEETNAFAQGWLTEQGRVITVAAPEKEGLATPTEEEVTAIFAAVAGKEIEPYVAEEVAEALLAEIPEGSAVVSEETMDTIGVTVWELENGVRVVLKPTDFRDDQVLFSATSPGGISLAPDEILGNARLADGLVSEGGVGEFDKIQLERQLADKRASASASIGSLTEGIRGSASPQDLETAFQLIYLRFVAPRKDETAFEAFKAQVDMMANMGAMPQFAMQDTVAVVMGQGHPRAGQTFEEELAGMREADLDVAFDFYKDRFADASDFTFYFVGTFDLEGIRPLVETYLGALPNLGRTENWVDHGVDPPPGVIEKVVRKGLEPQSRTMIFFTGEGEYSPEESSVLGAMADILQIGLRELLREDLGGTYGVGVSASLSYRPDEDYSVTIQFGSDPERAEELSAVVFEEIERLKADGPDAETVAKVRETQRRSKETSLRENGHWRSQLSSFESRGLDIRQIPSYDMIESWTAEQVQQAATRYLRTDQYVKVVLLPEQKIP